MKQLSLVICLLFVTSVNAAPEARSIDCIPAEVDDIKTSTVKTDTVKTIKKSKKVCVRGVCKTIKVHKKFKGSTVPKKK